MQSWTKLKFVILSSMAFAFLGLVSLIFNVNSATIFCGDKLYSLAYGECADVFHAKTILYPYIFGAISAICLTFASYKLAFNKKFRKKIYIISGIYFVPICLSALHAYEESLLQCGFICIPVAEMIFKVVLFSYFLILISIVWARSIKEYPGFVLIVVMAFFIFFVMIGAMIVSDWYDTHDDSMSRKAEFRNNLELCEKIWNEKKRERCVSSVKTSIHYEYSDFTDAAKVDLRVDKKFAQVGEEFVVSVEASSNVPLASAWWWINKEGARNSQQPILGTIEGASVDLSKSLDFNTCESQNTCEYSRTVSISSPGTYILSANARDELYGFGGSQASEGFGVPEIKIVIE